MHSLCFLSALLAGAHTPQTPRQAQRPEGTQEAGVGGVVMVETQPLEAGPGR